MSKSRDQSDSKISDKQISYLQQAKQFLFLRNYTLITSLKLTLSQAIILIIIQQLQKISIVTRYSVNPTLLNSPQMYYIDQFSKILLLDIFPITDNHNLVITILLIIGRLLIILVILVPLKGEVSNQVVSKYILTFLQVVLTLPSITLSVNFIIQGVNVGPNIILYLMTISTNLIYQSMQLQCSFQRQNTNVLVRAARPMTIKIINLVAVSSFPILNNFMYPTSFCLYSFLILIIQLYNWTYYLYHFIYFHQIFMHTKGMMLTINISANVCFLIIYVLNNAIISQNILLFIITFSVFLGNFFVIYRKYILKNTIINKELKGENQIGLYCVFYWHCYTKITQKKNQLYISSLLKKHTNQCDDPACCCKNREYLYDTYLKAFGNPKIQPHFDKIFIRYFIRKLLCDGYQKYNKSSMLAFLLSNYNIQIVEMITQTMQLIRKLSKMQQKKQLYFTEQFLLFSLKMKTRNKIISINLKRGNVHLQNVKQFDQQIIKLNDNLRTSVKVYHNLWKHLQNPKLNQAILYDICKNNLELMFSIQQNYKNLKNINTESSELRSIMLFYSRLILHDIHLLSQVRKDIKNGHERNMLLSTLQLDSIQLFGNNTATIISLQNSRIKWNSKNASHIFQYNKQQFHNITIKNLMPKYFADKHDEYIQRWKTTGHHIKMNRTTYLWGNTKNGDCFSMLMFVKVIPLLHDQQYAFFSCIQKLDDQSELICSSHGEVYGAGKLFSKATNINPKYLQEIKFNIQIFIPYTFDYFLQYFYPNNSKLKFIKRNVETRRQGYFPDNLQNVMKQIQEQRKIFNKKSEKAQNYNQQYLNFIRKQMQELTCHVNGQYISFSIAPFKLEEYQRQSQRIVVLKISNPKKDSIEKYYTQLQKMINKLQLFSQQETNKGIKSIFKRNKSDFFKAFLNPKRLKRLLQKQNEEMKQINQFNGQRQPSISKLKPTQTLFAHRKRLAMGAKMEIKNDRARYNIFKMKKILLQEGIISRYTYNILIGKNSTYNLSSDPQIDRNQQQTNKTLKQIEQDRNISDDQKNSIDMGSQGEIVPNKDNDNQTFNSGSSSATFISMTNHVKLFKLKLRSLNTPRLLLLLNIIILVALISQIFALIYLTITNVKNLSIGINQFKNNEQANLILDSLFLGQLNINNLNQSPNNTCYKLQRKYFLETLSTLYATQMQLRAQYKQIDQNILSYLQLTVIDQQVLTVIEFISLILNQIIANDFNHVMHYFTQSMQAIANHSIVNIFFNRISNNIFTIFLVSLVCSVALFILTLPIVYKLKIKIKQIYDLLSKISTNDKSKYFRHFATLNQQFKKKQEIQYTQLNNLTATYQSRFKYVKTNTKPGFSEQSYSKIQQKLQKTQQSTQQQSSISTDKVVYFKIGLIYLILMISIGFNYIFLNRYHLIFMNANDQFINLFNAKTKLTCRIVEGQYQMMGYMNETSYTSENIQFVQILYQTYSIDQISQQYRNYIFHFITANPCDLLPDLPLTQKTLCNKVNNFTFSQGGIDNLYYTQRKIQQKVIKYYISRNNTPNDQSKLIYPEYYRTKEYVGLNAGYYYSTLMIYKIYDKIYLQINLFANNYKIQFYIALGVSLTLIVVFIVLWIVVYLKLAENASYINAFLLLIPFDVLSQNPYIKLYIKNQFDYKTNY